MIWATVRSRSCFCWLYTASLSLATKNVINFDFSIDHLLMSMYKIVSCVVDKGSSLWLVHSLGRIQLTFSLLHFGGRTKSWVSFKNIQNILLDGLREYLVLEQYCFGSGLMIVGRIWCLESQENSIGPQKEKTQLYINGSGHSSPMQWSNWPVWGWNGSSASSLLLKSIMLLDSLEREKSEITSVFNIPGDLGSKYFWLILGSRIYYNVSSFYPVLHESLVLRTYWQDY